jgi:hypothetical protein
MQCATIPFDMRGCSPMLGLHVFLAALLLSTAAGARDCGLDRSEVSRARAVPASIIKRESRLLTRKELQRLLPGHRMYYLNGGVDHTFSIDYKRNGEFVTRGELLSETGTFTIKHGTICKLLKKIPNSSYPPWENPIEHCSKVYLRRNDTIWSSVRIDNLYMEQVKITGIC